VIVAQQFDMRPNTTTGVITGAVYGSNQILCGNVFSTQGEETSSRTGSPNDSAGDLRRCDSSGFSGRSTTRCGVVCIINYINYGVEEWERKAVTGLT
jgi:hypothetical protein